MIIVLIIFHRTIPGRKWTDGEVVIVHPSRAPRLSPSVYLADVARRVLREHEHGERADLFQVGHSVEHTSLLPRSRPGKATINP